MRWFDSGGIRHVIASQQFDREDLDELFFRTDHLLRVSSHDKSHNRNELSQWHAGQVLYSLFYEASTRTRFSFETAALRLGMNVVSSENARVFSSAAKGESLTDTINVLNEYNPDVVVLRHYEEGAAELAAEISTAPIINAGDGAGQHPTQSLLDVYTIHRELGRIDHTNVILGGDLRFGRTIRSLAYLLGKFEDVKIIFVAHEQLRVNDDITEYLDEHNVEYYETDELDDAIPQADVVYWTRTQRERLGEDIDFDEVSTHFSITKSTMDRLPDHAIVMHPLPRNSEIAEEVDLDRRAAYFRQAGYGLPVRMALLDYALSG